MGPTPFDNYSRALLAPACLSVVALAITLVTKPSPAGAEDPATIVVATCDSADSSKATAMFVGDCDGDEQQINAAIAALPPSGGTVHLAEGSYDIKAGPGQGGVVIDRSNVSLEGVGAATRLTLAAAQNTNVIRIAGNGTSDVVVEKLQIDGARGNFNSDTSDFEACGIKAASTGNIPLSNITVRQTKIYEAFRLNVMLDGVNVRIIDNWLGDAGSDVAEVLTGPAEILNNHVEISGVTGHGLGSDSASGVTISGNYVLVQPSGYVSESLFRFWPGQYQNILSNNQVFIYGRVYSVFMMNGYFNVIQGNIFRAWSARTNAFVNSGAAITGNIFENIDLQINDTSGEAWPVVIASNFFYATYVVGQLGIATQSGNVNTPPLQP